MGEFYSTTTAFRHDHEEQIRAYEEAVRRLKEIYPGSFPTMKALKTQQATFMKKRREAAAQQKDIEKERRTLQVAFNNVSVMLDQPVRTDNRGQKYGEMLE